VLGREVRVSRIRTIKPEIMTDEKLAPLSDSTRLLAKGLIVYADDHGRGKAHAGLLAVQVWPYGDPHEGLRKVETGLRELEAIEFCRVYTVKGQRYYALRNWTKHQRVQHPGAPRVPTPEQADDQPKPPTGGGSGSPDGGGSPVAPHEPHGGGGTQSSGGSPEALAPDLRSPISDHRIVGASDRARTHEAPPTVPHTGSGAADSGSQGADRSAVPRLRLVEPDSDRASSEWSRRDQRVRVLWRKKFMDVRQLDPAIGERDGKAVGEVVRVVGAQAERAEVDFDALLGRVLDAYWSEPYSRDPKSRPNIRNLVDQLDRLLGAMRPIPPKKPGPVAIPSLELQLAKGRWCEFKNWCLAEGRERPDFAAWQAMGSPNPPGRQAG
jgi:hypothetical protein